MVTGDIPDAAASYDYSSMLVLVMIILMSYFKFKLNGYCYCYHLTNWCIESMGLLTDVYLLGCMVYIAYPTA